jgi:2-polyprenyl-6-methoxyphenol hydroxylase-like FAD-dependent oxidoreductase
VEFLGAYTAYFTVPDPGDLGNWFEMYNAPGGLVAGLRPERGGTAKASLSFTAPSPMYERASVEQQQEALRSRLAGAGWRVPSMLAAMPSAPDFYFDSINRVTVESWSRGRVVLIGDAGYCGSPLAGLGTSMSLVGAYVLAGELAVAGGDHERAFAAYEREMGELVRQSRAFAEGAARTLIPATRTGVWALARGGQLISALPAGVSRALAKLNSGGARMHDSMRVKDYEVTPVG